MTYSLVHFMPYFLFTLFGLSLTTKIYKRSISTFIIIIGASVSSTFHYYEMYEYASLAVIITLGVIFIRAMLKADIDTFIVRTYSGKEKRNQTKIVVEDGAI